MVLCCAMEATASPQPHINTPRGVPELCVYVYLVLKDPGALSLFSRHSFVVGRNGFDVSHHSIDVREICFHPSVIFCRGVLRESPLSYLQMLTDAGGKRLASRNCIEPASRRTGVAFPCVRAELNTSSVFTPTRLVRVAFHPLQRWRV